MPKWQETARCAGLDARADSSEALMVVVARVVAGRAEEGWEAVEGKAAAGRAEVVEMVQVVAATVGGLAGVLVALEACLAATEGDKVGAAERVVVAEAKVVVAGPTLEGKEVETVTLVEASQASPSHAGSNGCSRRICQHHAKLPSRRR